MVAMVSAPNIGNVGTCIWEKAWHLALHFCFTTFVSGCEGENYLNLRG